MRGCLLFLIFPFSRRAPLVFLSGVSRTLDEFTVEAVSAGITDLVLSTNIALRRHVVKCGNSFEELVVQELYQVYMRKAGLLNESKNKVKSEMSAELLSEKPEYTGHVGGTICIINEELFVYSE